MKLPVVNAVFWGWLQTSTSFAAAPDRIEFNRDIRPILSENCFFCHGPDSQDRRGDLRLDERSAALDRKAIVPGKPLESALIERILSTDPDLKMPPPESSKRLTAQQLELLQRWIAQGAEYQKHWAYEPPRKTPIPEQQVAIDWLVSRRLAEIGRTAAPEADRRTLIRRLYSDLIGLPPSPEEVESFLNDSTTDAYEQLVDRLLGDPRYGERMAMPWLDVVRFADTIGYHSDTPRNVWPYRDWVISAFNDNKPFDRFTIEQLAGDLLPDANQETRVGSAFNRLLLTTEEGGAQAKDYESRMLADRVRAVGAIWLGQTTGCAQCHDHKFDPITMQDFYALGAFFADIQEPIIGRREEGLVVASAAEHQQLADLDARLLKARKAYEAIEPELIAAQAEWAAAVLKDPASWPALQADSNASEAERKQARQIYTLLQAATLNNSQKQQVQNYFREHITALHPDVRQEFRSAEQARQNLYSSLAKCLVSVSSSQRRVVRIQPRGNWMDETGAVVQAALPHYLPQPAAIERPLTRLDLAQWLVSRENPLTARVTVNRFWKQFFGRGLCKSLDDFGAQGEPPTHPELLDWLACEFMENGWDVKHLVRLIVTSQTYRQASAVSAEQLATDPENRELARQATFRHDAELVRDYALQISGLLESRIGGPSVKPYQPDGYWENLNFPRRIYVADTGPAQHRRGLYTWWQRSFLHPSLLAFDAPTREECAADRTRSNIPQQALVLLNDPTYVEAAGALSRRLLADKNLTDKDRVQKGWLLTLQRQPTPQELAVVLQLLSQQRQSYAREPAAVEQLAKSCFQQLTELESPSEWAAWTHIARVLLNLHETITRS